MHNPKHPTPKARRGSPRARQSVVVVISLLLCGTAALLVTPVRTASLRALGGTLVAEDPVEPADAIVVTVDVGTAGFLEAADLVHAGIATRVAFFVDSASPADDELRRRGVADERGEERAMRQLRALGVQSIERMPETVEGSEDEGGALATWCARRGLRSVIVVTSADHSRRLHRLFHRALKDGSTRVSVRVARLSEFDANRWWQTRTGLRTGIIELEKLMLDVARHPVS